MQSPPPTSVRLRFFLPPGDLRPFVTTIYQMIVEAPEDTPIEDRLHPEWANLRFLVEGEAQAAVGEGPLQPVPLAVVAGPTSKTTRFRSYRGQTWGVGLLPLGWTRLTEASASDYADSFGSMFDDPAMVRLQPFHSAVATPHCEADRMRSRLIAALRQAIGPAQPREDDIVRIEVALVDPVTRTVAQLAEQTGTSTRTLERLCNLAFGFPPQLLLRRQRFLRSLAQYMLDPSLNWIETLDSQYHDQAHFVRDFKRFMGMSPSAYARLPHPVLSAAAQARKAIAGEAVQVLHKPPLP